MQPVSLVPRSGAAAEAPPAPAAASAQAGDKQGHLVNSPFVGTFYRTPAPDQPAFVEVGSVVKKGQVLCIIEAMKLMNEIDSEYDGEIVTIYVENGQPVQYGERLFAIRTR
jgi:acetyl-CoA carboxylase biotin carboxyl carrier protein